MLQIIKDQTIINIPSAEVMHLAGGEISALFSVKSLSSSEKDIILNNGELCVSTNVNGDTFESKHHFVRTSTRDGGSSMALLEDQWLVTFEF